MLRQAPGRYRLLIVLALLTLAVVYVPSVPYSPYCRGKELGVGPVCLAAAFRADQPTISISLKKN